MTIEEMRERIHKLRIDWLCDNESIGLDPIAEAHAALALNALDEARIHCEIAILHHARALGANRR